MGRNLREHGGMGDGRHGISHRIKQPRKQVPEPGCAGAVFGNAKGSPFHNIGHAERQQRQQKVGAVPSEPGAGTVGNHAHDWVIERIEQPGNQRNGTRLLRIQTLHIGQILLVELTDRVPRAA